MADWGYLTSAMLGQAQQVYTQQMYGNSFTISAGYPTTFTSTANYPSHPETYGPPATEVISPELPSEFKKLSNHDFHKLLDKFAELIND